MAYNDEEGSKYQATKQLSRASLKDVMLAEVKAAIASGDLPKCRVSMREGTGVGTMSLRVTLAGVPFAILNAGRVRHDEVVTTVYMDERDCPRYSDEAVKLRERVRRMISEYNYDRSDIQTDYFNVRFYLDVNIKSEEERAERDAIVKAASAKRREISQLLDGAEAVMSDIMLSEGKPSVTRFGRGADEYFARQFDTFCTKRGHAAGLSAKLAELKALPEDWDHESALAAQAAHVAAKSKPTKASPAAATAGALSPGQKAAATRRANKLAAVAS